MQKPPSRRLQFSLADLLEFCVWIAIYLGIYSALPPLCLNYEDWTNLEDYRNIVALGFTCWAARLIRRQRCGPLTRQHLLDAVFLLGTPMAVVVFWHATVEASETSSATMIILAGITAGSGFLASVLLGRLEPDECGLRPSKKVS
jgi:hypothetical protein